MNNSACTRQNKENRLINQATINTKNNQTHQMSETNNCWMQNRSIRRYMNNAPVGIVYTKHKDNNSATTVISQKRSESTSNVIGQPARTCFASDADYEALGQIAGPGPGFRSVVPSRTGALSPGWPPIWVDAVAYLIDAEHPAEGTIWILDRHFRPKTGGVAAAGNPARTADHL